jgi:hypothetical protein
MNTSPELDRLEREVEKDEQSLHERERELERLEKDKENKEQALKHAEVEVAKVEGIVGQIKARMTQHKNSFDQMRQRLEKSLGIGKK